MNNQKPETMRHYSWNDGPENEPKYTNEELEEMAEKAGDERFRTDRDDNGPTGHGDICYSDADSGL